ncbi:MAG: Rv3654c family TadE-like protein [Pseudonocardiaceae bacterium]
MTADGEADRGAATVWAVGAIAGLMSVTVFGLYLGAALVARHQAEAAADLAALAGAGSVVLGEDYACARARRVTEQMAVRLASCQIRGENVLIETATIPTSTHLSPATARARAGPV